MIWGYPYFGKYPFGFIMKFPKRVNFITSSESMCFFLASEWKRYLLDSSSKLGISWWSTVFWIAIPKTMHLIWAIYYKSLAWFKTIWGWGIPLLNEHFGWLLGGKGRYKLPRPHFGCTYTVDTTENIWDIKWFTYPMEARPPILTTSTVTVYHVMGSSPLCHVIGGPSSLKTCKNHSKIKTCSLHFVGVSPSEDGSFHHQRSSE